MYSCRAAYGSPHTRMAYNEREYEVPLLVYNSRRRSHSATCSRHGAALGTSPAASFATRSAKLRALERVKSGALKLPYL